VNEVKASPNIPNAKLNILYTASSFNILKVNIPIPSIIRIIKRLNIVTQSTTLEIIDRNVIKIIN